MKEKCVLKMGVWYCELLGKVCHLKSLPVQVIVQMWTLTYSVMRYYALSKDHQLIEPHKMLEQKNNNFKNENKNQAEICRKRFSLIYSSSVT